MKSLGKRMIEVMKACQSFAGDREQRSALGVAYNWVSGSQIDVSGAQYDEAGVSMNRDALAGVFIQMMVDTPKPDCRAALQEARVWLNAPFANDPAILAWREERAARGPIGTEKKEKEARGQ